MGNRLGRTNIEKSPKQVPFLLFVSQYPVQISGIELFTAICQQILDQPATSVCLAHV